MNTSAIWQFLKFTFFSASAALVELGSFALINELLHWSYWPAYLTALILSVIWNFTLNRRFTFRSAANVPIAMAKILGFYLVFTPLSTWLGHIAEGAGINEYAVLGVTMFANFVTKYLFCKFVVFRGQENTLDTKKEHKE